MFVIAAENLPSALYTPLVVLLVAYAALTLLAGRARGKEDMDGADRWAMYAFVVLLVAALYTIVLVIAAVFNYPSRSTDMVTVVIVICGFFALLLFAFFLITEVLPAALRRGRRSASVGRRAGRAGRPLRPTPRAAPAAFLPVPEARPARPDRRCGWRGGSGRGGWSRRRSCWCLASRTRRSSGPRASGARRRRRRRSGAGA